MRSWQNISTLRISQAWVKEDLYESGSSSELSLQFPLKQVHCCCFSLPSSIKFWTIFARQNELGSNSSKPSLLQLCSGSVTPPDLSGADVFKTLENGLSKSHLNLDLNTGFTTSSHFGCGSSGELKSIG